MAMTMALQLLFLLFASIFSKGVFCEVSIKTSIMFPFTCSQNATCDAFLYHISRGPSIQEIASNYRVISSQIKPIIRRNKVDYLISVPCRCQDIDTTTGYFYNSIYTAKSGDTSDKINEQIYSGQAWGEAKPNISIGDVMDIHLLCGCYSGNSEVVTYTVQNGDTMNAIATMFSSSVDAIQSLNTKVTQTPSFIDVGWVFFVPMNIDTVKEGKNKKPMVIGIVISLAFLVAGLVLVILYRLNRPRQRLIEDPRVVAKGLNVKGNPKVVAKSLSGKDLASLQNQYLEKESIEGFESERPLIFSLQEIEEATMNCDETRKIGEGGYGSVYFGMVGELEVAIKKMKSNKCKEFFTELKVLCKVHHINVVELIGYASGDDHLYLVYEYVQNGSLSEHLHDPLMKGHQPLSWNARAQIALDAARGIEYIHDHTKARYVHRDIKTSNILLDQGLRAKVADFGLAKLVERSCEEDFIATRLVGTPGYLPPESVRELQMTSKSDVFAFGVVLAELITGQRALNRDHQEPNKMKSLISVVYNIFQEEDPESALEAHIDGNLKGSYPIEEVFKIAQIAVWCLSEDAVNRPEMREIVVKLSQILSSSVEWEASLGGNSQVFSGIFNGR